MNKLIKYIQIVLFVIAILLFNSCNLDMNPYDEVSHGSSWKTYDDVLRFRNGLYSFYRNIQGGRYMYTDFQADLFNATVGFGNNQGDLYTWNFSNSQSDIVAYWLNNYAVINDANNVINNIDRIEGDSEEQKAMLQTIKGEAYFIRALCYHSLVIRFAKDYEPSSATSDLGLPIIEKENEVDNKPERSTLRETYDYIKNSIVTAGKLLPETTPETGRLSVNALNLFEARVDLYMHNYAEAIVNAEKVISQYTLITSGEDLKEMWLNDIGSEIIFQPEQTANERAGSLGIYLQYDARSQSFQPYYIPTQWVVDLYKDTDIRLEATFLKAKATSSSHTEEDVYLLNKYPGNPDLKKTTYEYFNKMKTFRVAEAYLIAAEAAYRDDSPAETVLGFLNNLRQARNASKLEGLSGINLFSEIKNEWIREYIGEAKRLDDLKRWHDGFERHDSQNKSVVMTGKNYNTKSVEAGDIKFVWEIPGHELSVNPKLKPNWR